MISPYLEHPPRSIDDLIADYEAEIADGSTPLTRRTEVEEQLKKLRAIKQWRWEDSR